MASRPVAELRARRIILSEQPLADAAEQLREAVGRIEGAEFEWAARETARLEERLRTLGTELQHLSALKAAFATPH